MERTLINACGSLPSGSLVSLSGWIRHIRDLGGIRFLVLEDRTGKIQLVIQHAVHPTTIPAELPVHSAVTVSAVLHRDPRAPGGVEAHVREIAVSGTAETLPWQPDPFLSLSELGDERYRYRVLALQTPAYQTVFRVQAQLGEAFRTHMASLGFLEVHSPKIVGSGTEGGTELFPVQYFNTQAFLAQSPQFYKEMLVAAGFERVFEVGPVFRAEPHATRRHLNEYISLDVEAGFVETLDDLLTLEAGLIGALAEAVPDSLRAPWLTRPPASLTFSEAADVLCRHYGKLIAPGHLDPEAERILCRYVGGTEAQGAVFITEWPESVRPFYARRSDDNATLTSSFDFLAGGLEITTGGLREHRRDVLVAQIAARGLDPADFAFYTDAFGWGMPPHGGFAIGLERLTMVALGLDNVRDASLFPRDRVRLWP